MNKSNTSLVVSEPGESVGGQVHGRVAQLGHAFMAAVLMASVTSSTALAGVDSLTLDGDSKVSELGAFTGLIVTAAELTEDYLAPVGAIIILGISFWNLFFKRDFMQFAMGLFAAIGLGGMAYFMESIITAFTA